MLFFTNVICLWKMMWISIEGKCFIVYRNHVQNRVFTLMSFYFLLRLALSTIRYTSSVFSSIISLNHSVGFCVHTSWSESPNYFSRVTCIFQGGIFKYTIPITKWNTPSSYAMNYFFFQRPSFIWYRSICRTEFISNQCENIDIIV